MKRNIFGIVGAMALLIVITGCSANYTGGVAQVGQPSTFPGQPPGFGVIKCVLADGYTDPGVQWTLPGQTARHLGEQTGNMLPTTTTVTFTAPGMPNWQAPNVRVAGGRITIITVSFTGAK